MESPQTSSQDAAVETPTQRQARLRRERREAKLKVEGTSRLERISKASGRQNLPDLPPDIGKVSSDPDEVDLSTHPSAIGSANLRQKPSSSQEQPSEAELRAMLRAGAPAPGMEVEGAPSGEDPMMKMLSQLMGGIPGSGNGIGEINDASIPPGLAAMLGASGAAGTAATPSEQSQDTFGYLWRIIHAVSALCLGLYIAATSSAFGQTIERGSLGAGPQETPKLVEGPNLFFIFATFELVLQSSRLYLEKDGGGGKLGGWIGLVAGFLPEPYRGYAILIGKYARIWGTVVEDAMVVIFVIGCMSWRSAVVR